MEIQRATIIGLGALGILFGHRIMERTPPGTLTVLADAERARRYERDGVYVNGERCTFHYSTPQEPGKPADLLIFAVKFADLEAAVETAKNHVGPETIILSLLNGIVSEDVIGRALGHEKVLPAVAQGMDAVKVGNQMTYTNMGLIAFGDRPGGGAAEKVEAVRRFFTRAGVPHQVDGDMRKRMWGKFMLNVGVNQAVAVLACDYGGVQREGTARDAMTSAMREALTLARAEGVDLAEDDLSYWLNVLSTLNPAGKPSMRQDLEAGRKSEVGLFAGTVLELGKKHGIDCPVNRMLFDRITAIERGFSRVE
jgi:2-dehydropantoate 2-reductase